jgi:hypothetical protein
MQGKRGGLLAPVLASMGAGVRPGEDANAPLLRVELTEALGYFGEEPVINRARRMLVKRMIAIALGPEVPAGSNLDILLHLAQNHPDLVWKASRNSATGEHFQGATMGSRVSDRRVLRGRRTHRGRGGL